MNGFTEQNVGTTKSVWSSMVSWSGDAANDDGEVLTLEPSFDSDDLLPSA